MGNTIFLNQDKQFCEIILEGDQTSEMIRQLMLQSLELYDQMNQKYGQVKTLVDLSKLGKYDMGTIATASKSIKIATFDKMAIFGVSSAVRATIDLIVGLAGKQAIVQIFASRPEAEAWLMQ